MVVKDIENIKKDFSKRLNEVLDEHHFKEEDDGRQTALGKMFNVSQNAARKWLLGEALPQLSRVLQICERFDINPLWLLMGSTPKYLNKEKEHKKIVEKTMETEKAKNQIKEVEKQLIETISFLKKVLKD